MATLSIAHAGTDDGAEARPRLMLVPTSAAAGHGPSVGDSPDILSLYRVVGPTELAMLEAADWSVVPERSEWSVILYRFTSLEDAQDLMRSKHRRDQLAIVEVPIDRVFAETLRVDMPDRLAGRTEYWASSPQLAALNSKLRGRITRVR
ncbi:MAG: hypothetical protein JWM86_158 [Thermoleophilia bacterium]|nr:hypothetical protein [Thermoleophilia bacterium]